MALQAWNAYISAVGMTNASKNIRSYMTRHVKTVERTEFLQSAFRKVEIEFSCECDISVAWTVWYRHIIRQAIPRHIIVPAANKHSYVMSSLRKSTFSNRFRQHSVRIYSVKKLTFNFTRTYIHTCPPTGRQ
jgi:hypothetical protein